MLGIQSLKTCRVCKTDKPLEAFHRDSHSKDGRQARCRSCNNVVCKRYRHSHLDKVREARKAFRQTSTPYLMAYNRRWIAKNHAARLAHLKVYRAVKSGKIAKPETCQRCCKGNCRLEAHHADYSKPLDVEWLCNICHSEETNAANAVVDDAGEVIELEADL